MKGPHLEAAQWQEAVDRSARHHLQPPIKWDYNLPLAAERRLLVMWEKLALGQEV